jgi:serine/threonine protein kinase
MFTAKQQIGPYILVKKLGRGGFGEVWLAERRTEILTTKVAIKLPLQTQIDIKEVKREATLWEKASGHPNVLPIIEANMYDGQIVIVSEYASDGSLEDVLKREGNLSTEKSIELMSGVLSGLEFLHSRKIIHRDLKPANILLQGNTPRLADFGISRALRTTQTSSSNTITGTWEYMAPEAIDGKRNEQTDVWSAGVTLYKLLTRRLPFPQNEPTALVGAIMTRNPDPMPDSIPKSLQEIVLCALSKNPEERYQSAWEMRDELREVNLHDEIYLTNLKTMEDELTIFTPKEPASTLPLPGEPVSIIPPLLQPAITNPPVTGNLHTVVKTPAITVKPRRISHFLKIMIGVVIVSLVVITSPVMWILMKNKQAANVNNNNPNTNSQIVVLPNVNVSPLPSPSPTPDIKKINFKKVTFPLGQNEMELTQKDLTVEQVSYGDLNSDGIDEAAVLVQWSFARQGGNGFGRMGYIYTMADNKLKLLTQFGGGDKFENLALNVRIKDALLVITRCVHDSKGIPFIDTASYRVSGTKLLQIGKTNRREATEKDANNGCY